MPAFASEQGFSPVNRSRAAVIPPVLIASTTNRISATVRPMRQVSELTVRLRLALVDQHVVQAGAEVPQDEDQDADDEQGLQRIVHGCSAMRDVRMVRALSQQQDAMSLRRATCWSAGCWRWWPWRLRHARRVATGPRGTRRRRCWRAARRWSGAAAAAGCCARSRPRRRRTTGRRARVASPDATVLLDNQQREGRVGVRMYCVLFSPTRACSRCWSISAGGRWTASAELPGVGCPAGAVQRCAACWRRRRPPASPRRCAWRRRPTATLAG